MGTDNRYVGEAVAVVQVDTFTPTNVEIGDVFTLTSIGWDGVTEVLPFTATAATAANVAAALVALWNASESSACTGVTASGTVTVILTADTAGVAFSVTATAVQGGGADDQTLDRVATTKNEGPSDYTSVDNWSLGIIPVNTHDVYAEGSFSILYGLDQSAVELDSFNTSGVRIGTNPAAGWRPVFLQVRAPVVEIGYHYGPSAVTQQVPVNLDLGSGESASIVVHNSGSNGTSPGVRMTCVHASTVLEVRKGNVGFYNNSGGTAELDIINMGYTTNKAGDVDVFVEEACTIDTINQEAGDLLLRSALTTALTIESGTLKTEGSGAIPTMVVNGGTATLNSSGTVGGTGGVTVNGGIVDFTKSAVARTATNVKPNPGATVKYDPDVLTITFASPDKPVTLTASGA